MWHHVWPGGTSERIKEGDLILATGQLEHFTIECAVVVTYIRLYQNIVWGLTR